MQQASSPITRLVPAGGNNLPPASESARFVINLCASTTPVGLVQPQHPALKRFTFFVSRRREEGRERFRLHMGYFATQQEAEKVLPLVRDVYPAAWVGNAPGQALNARAAAAEKTAAAAPAKGVVANPPTAATVPTAPAAPTAPLKLELVPDVPRAQQPAPAAPGTPGADLNAPQVLRLLEAPRAAPAAAHRALPQATAPAEAPAFAVQLLWSVQPIDMSRVPRLAIFAAYRLYGAEGNREGRRWYGLRLGFFKDATSARQVAQYVRSEFSSVSVVPVSARERDSASTAPARPLPPLASAKGTGHELNFIEDVATDNATSGSRPALQAPDATQATAPAAPAVLDSLVPVTAPARMPPGKRAKLRVGHGISAASRHGGHGHGKERTRGLDQTLEVLGAGSLQMAPEPGERVNDATSRDRSGATSKPQRSSRFGRLMERLSERFSA